ncbi:hypothetical protein ABTZ44_08460 [Microbacterium oxydans]|uniref:Uncharacterized protein n=1 Tax=Microbacterium oxydans TaxID=82380 RepID=A0A147E1E7_9MICO|nr:MULTISPECIES: hypothetical protein [Microbacterium]AZS42023.1 hypothetical protein CVS54_03385 [Microbacterium oxydans]KAB1893129.1 hypothetical protein F6W69_03500 [Microbacterium oxydans]KKX98447.1 hypothetical protein AAY78_06295 [Microbacterium sp. Ag1]KTR77123.1 hypothetical protein NS234_08790 [Microbacterium oxydans]MBE7953052.1 hypothetical protein [Microbacterium sp. R1]
MKGKIGLVVGLGVGYVLGTRAGRERYEQIKTQWLKVWHLDPVQEQVTKVKGFVGDKAAAVPGALWTGVVKVAKSVSGNGTPGQRLDSAIATGREAAEDLAEATEEAVEAAKATASSSKTSTSASSKPAAKKPAAKKPAAKSATKKSGA